MYKKWFNLWKHRNILSILISVMILFVLLWIKDSWIPIFVNQSIQSIYFIENDSIASDEIVVVEIDEETLAGRRDVRTWNITVEWLWRFPFDRKYYATVIDNLHAAGAAVVGLDVIFWEQSNASSDKLLADSIKNAGNVVLGLWTENHGLKDDESTQAESGFWHTSKATINTPYQDFYDGAYHAWYFEVKIDNRTENAYGIYPFSKFFRDDRLYEHFSIALLKAYYAKIYWDDSFLEWDIKSNSKKFIVSDRIELIKSKNDAKDVLINYAYNKKTGLLKINRWSFLDVYHNKLNKDYFKDKIVVIWATASGIKDIFFTPVGQQYGVYLHANLINTLITKNGIKYLDEKVEFFIIFLLVIVAVYFNLSISGRVLFFSNVFIIWLSFFLAYYITFLTSYLPSFTFELLLWVIFSLAISNIVKYMIENKNKTKLNKALSEYVSEDVAKEILSWEGKINLNGENKDIAIFFSDIEGFTTISEQFSPEELVSFLREYLSTMSHIIMDEGWFINKYEWDAVMALWWVFTTDMLDAYGMCYGALKQQSELKKLNEKWKKRKIPEIKTRMWLHSWPAIIWNIWAQWRKMEFTALWDSVNVASRLEWVNKFYGTYICASEDIYQKQKEHFEFRYLDRIKVKGKDKAIKIYELVAIRWDLTKQQQEVIFNFRVATNLYNEQKFSEALIIFKQLAVKWDGPSRTYLDRCEQYMKNPPGDHWDGVWTMTEK